MSTENKFHLPTRPYDIVGQINRIAAGQGSVSYAMATEYADYNGHHVRVYWNDYRQYWLAEYQWGQRVVLCRGSLLECVSAAKREYDRGALGSAVSIFIPTQPGFGHPAPVIPEGAIERIKELGFQEGAEDITKADWYTWKHPEAAIAIRMEAQGLGTINKLLKADTLEGYRASISSR